MDVRRVAFGWGTQMAYSSTTSVPRPSVHPRAMLLSHYISCRCPLKRPVLFRERGFLIAFPCRCFFFFEGVVPQAEGRVLRDELYKLTSAVKPHQGKCVRVERCWKCRQPCRDTWKSHNSPSINKCMGRAFFLMDEKPLTFWSNVRAGIVLWHLTCIFLFFFLSG